MIFRSSLVAKTWDAWTIYHEGQYYLFYLTSEKYPGDGFGVATSTDALSWTDHGRVLSPSAEMVRYLGSGFVWKDVDFADTGRFLCNYSEWRTEGAKNVQSIYFAWSRDLIHWTKYGDDFVFRIDERFNKRVEAQPRGPWEDPRWDCINAVSKQAGGYYGYWTATPKDFLGFGFGTSADGLHWEALAPPRIEWGETPSMIFVEVGGVHEIAGKYYAMLADYATTTCGVFGFVADSPAGPFRPCARNFGLMRNRRKMHAYFTRFVDSPDGTLVCHHSVAEGQFSDDTFAVYYAPFKKALLIDGSLYLAWWHGNDKLKHREVPLDSLPDIARFDPEAGVVIEGVLTLPARLTLHDAKGAMTAIQVGMDGVTEIGPIQPDGTDFHVDESVDRQIALGSSPTFRLLLHRNMLEFYLDDLFIQCYSMDNVSNGTVQTQNVDAVRIWQWK